MGRRDRRLLAQGVGSLGFWGLGFMGLGSGGLGSVVRSFGFGEKCIHSGLQVLGVSLWSSGSKAQGFGYCALRSCAV